MRNENAKQESIVAAVCMALLSIVAQAGQEEWLTDFGRAKAVAREKHVSIQADYPQRKQLPAQTVRQNAALSQQYGIEMTAPRHRFGTHQSDSLLVRY